MIDLPVNFRRWLLAACVLASLLFLLVQTAPASATSYSFKSCDAITHDKSSFGEDWEGGGLGSFNPPTVDCPAGIRFDTGHPVLQGTKAAAWFRPSSDSIIKSVKFRYYGGDATGEYAYTVRSCVAGCDAVGQLVPDGGTSLKTAIFIMPQVELPEVPSPGPLSISIQIECVAAFCGDPPELVAKNFEFEYDDSVSPSVTEIQTEPENVLGAAIEEGATGATGSEGANWINGEDFGLTYDITDHGSGVQSSYFGVDSKLPEPAGGASCHDPQGARMCDEFFSVDTTVDIRGLADGEHLLGINATDAAISESFVERFPFFVDNGRPGEPTGLDFSENVTQWGWTNAPGIVVSHDDATLDPKNTEYSGFKAATFDLRPSANAEPAVEDIVFDPVAPSELIIPHEGSWDVGVEYSDNAGNEGNRAHGFVGFDSDTPEPADPTPLGWISLDQLHAGVDQHWTAPPESAELESGICAYAFKVDDEPSSIPDPDPDVLAPTTSARVPSGIGEGNHFAHVRAIACNGNASFQAPSPVDVDGSAPTPTFHGPASADWLTSPPNISLSATDALSGVAGLEYGFGGASSLNLVPGSSTPVTIPQGALTLSYRAIDVVGNVSPLIERPIKADWTPPAAEFLPRELTQPNVLTAEIDDAHSGLAGVGMQFRRNDAGASAIESNWRSLGNYETLTNAGTKSETISRTIPDGQLADGNYEFRVIARDVAGNSSESEPVLKLTLPLRAKPVLSAAIATVGKRAKVNWSGASQDRVVVFGKKSALVGSLLDGARKPIANARIAITTTPQFGVPGRPEAVTTDARGEFVVRLPNGPTRRFDLHFDGNGRFRPIDQTANIRVRAALDFKISKRTVRSGEGFTLSGRLLSKSMGLPEGGKIVSIRFLRKRTWMPTYATPPVDADGRFKYRSSEGLTAKRKTTVYFQVTAIRDGAWPFLTGSSKIVPLRIKP